MNVMRRKSNTTGFKDPIFKDKVAVITGAGSGIGQQLAIQLSAKGCHLALADISQAGLDKTQQLLSDDADEKSAVKISIHIVDVADQAQMESFAATIATEHGAANYLFNNAGVALGARIDAVSYDDMHWLMNINYWGVVHGCTAFIPLLKQQKMAHIVNVSSVFGLFTTPYNGIYSASKFAVNGFTDALAQELRKTHINVSCAFPAGIKTDIAKSARIVADLDNNRSAKDLQTTIEKLFWTSAEQAAAEILKGVTKNKQRILVGKGATLMDIIRRLLPVNYSRFLKI
jgi:short-subunit dehydrogenase